MKTGASASKAGVVTSEFWLSAGGAALITQAPTGLHAIGIGLAVGLYAIARALSKGGAA